MKQNSAQSVEVLSVDAAQYDGVSSLAWFEGMQLLPQHFQYSDRRIDHLLQRYANGCFAHHWGLDQLSFDTVALANGTLRITRVFGQFEDGLVFGHQQHHNGPLEFDFSTLQSEMPLRLALALPVCNFDSSAGVVTRHKQDYGIPVANFFNMDEKASIARLQPQLSIQVWRPERTDYVQLPLIEIQSTAHGFEVTTYHPPAVRILVQSTLEKTIFDVAQALRRAAEFVRGHSVPRRLPTDYSIGHGWILSCLIGGLSKLEAKISSRIAHPYDLHLSMCDIAGQVAAISGTVPPYFPGYDHFDPAASIKVVASFIINGIPDLAPVQELTLEIPFEKQPTLGTWQIVMPAHFTSRSATLVIKLFPTDSAIRLTEWIDSALICYVGQIGRCRELRISGLPRRLVETVTALGLTSDAHQGLLHIEGLDASALNESLMVEFAQDAAKTLIKSISLVIQNA